MTPRERVSDERLAQIESLAVKGGNLEALCADLWTARRERDEANAKLDMWAYAAAEPVELRARLARIEAWAAQSALPALRKSGRCYACTGCRDFAADALDSYPTPGRDAPAPEANDADTPEGDPRPDPNVRAADTGCVAPVPRRSGGGDDRDAEGSSDAAPSAAGVSPPATSEGGDATNDAGPARDHATAADQAPALHAAPGGDASVTNAPVNVGSPADAAADRLRAWLGKVHEMNSAAAPHRVWLGADAFDVEAVLDERGRLRAAALEMLRDTDAVSEVSTHSLRALLAALDPASAAAQERPE